MTSYVGRVDWSFTDALGGTTATSSGLGRRVVVGPDQGAIHTELAVGALAPGGWLAPHVHSFEEALYVLEGELILELDRRVHRLVRGDYAAMPVGLRHTLANAAGAPVRWLSVNTPQRLGLDAGRKDTFFESPADVAALDASATRPPFGDPTLRLVGHYDGTPPQADALRVKDQARGRAPAGMDTALLAYSGISVRMLVDRNFGADLVTMFTVDYEIGGAAQAHDHPFEETYFFLEGEMRRRDRWRDVSVRTGRYRVRRGGQRPRVLQRGHGTGALDRDAGAATAGSPCLPMVRELEAIRGGTLMSDEGAVGRRRRHARDRPRDRSTLRGDGPQGRGDRPDAANVDAAVAALEGHVTGLAFDLARPETIAPALADVGPVRHLVVVAIDRDDNTIKEYDIGWAARLTVLKLVGYAEVVHTLLDRLDDTSSIVLFGGQAKDLPYPGSTTVSSVNGGVEGFDPLARPPAQADPGQLHPSGDRRRQPVLEGPAGCPGGDPGTNADRPHGHHGRDCLGDGLPAREHGDEWRVSQGRRRHPRDLSAERVGALWPRPGLWHPPRRPRYEAPGACPAIIAWAA